MNEKPDAVADAVCELDFETCRGQHRATGRIDFATRDAGMHGRHPRFARAANNIMTRAHVIGARAIDDERSGHVGVVTVDECAEVDHHCIATKELAVGRVMMRKCGVRTRGDDRRKTDVVGTQPAHGGVEFVAKLTFGSSCDDQPQHFGECFVGDSGSAPDSLEFGVALGSAQIGENRRTIDECGTFERPPLRFTCRNERLEFGHRDVTGLEAPRIAGDQEIGDGLAHRRLRASFDHAHVRLRATCLDRRLLGVPTIGDQDNGLTFVG